MSARAGHHGAALYEREPAFDESPTDPDPKVFGSNTNMDTFEAAHEAVRVYNMSRRTAEIVEQVFDGAWGATFELSEPPWWLDTVLGDPVSTELVAPTHEHSYDLDNGNTPRSLRLYLPTEGFNEYEVIAGAVVTTMTIDQSVPGNPEVTLSGGYAREPFSETTLTLDVPNLTESTFNNRKAKLLIDGQAAGYVQSTTITVETNTDLINELGTGHAVDFSPKAFNPTVDYEKIVATDQDVDLLQRFKDATQVDVALGYDNGLSDADQYQVDFTVGASFPDSWSESGRGDAEADLTEDLSDMAEDFTAVITNDDSAPQ